MQILDRVVTKANICGIELAFAGDPIPSTVSGWQPFYNTTFDGADFSKVYTQLAAVDYAEESNASAAGTSYKQKVIIRFPASDHQRAERIQLMQTVKFVKVILTNGRSLVIGRNDFEQNTPPVISTKSNSKLCEVSFESQSIFSSGYTPHDGVFGLPALIPISF